MPARRFYRGFFSYHGKMMIQYRSRQPLCGCSCKDCKTAKAEDKMWLHCCVSKNTCHAG